MSKYLPAVVLVLYFLGKKFMPPSDELRWNPPPKATKQFKDKELLNIVKASPELCTAQNKAGWQAVFAQDAVIEGMLVVLYMFVLSLSALAPLRECISHFRLFSFVSPQVPYLSPCSPFKTMFRPRWSSRSSRPETRWYVLGYLHCIQEYYV